MKKITKAILSFVLILCACVFVGCGKGNPDELDKAVKVNTASNAYALQNDKTIFTNLNKSDDDSYIEASQYKKFKMTFKATSTDFDDSVITTKMNAIMEFNDSGIPTLASKGTSSSTLDGITTSQSVGMYIVDNKVYISSSVMGFYFDLNDYSLEDAVSGGSSVDVTSFDLSQAMDSLSEYILDENVTLEYAEEGQIKKFKISCQDGLYDEELEETFKEAVLVLDNGTFAGLYYSTIEADGTQVEMNMVPYSGEIKFPSFEGYINFNDMFGGIE